MGQVSVPDMLLAGPPERVHDGVGLGNYLAAECRHLTQPRSVLLEVCLDGRACRARPLGESLEPIAGPPQRNPMSVPRIREGEKCGTLVRLLQVPDPLLDGLEKV